MKKSLTTLGFALLIGITFAQQDAQFSQYMFNKLDFNPGYAGTSKAICLTAFYRDQWVSFPGAPKTALFSIDAYLPPLLGGLGLTLCTDQLGFEKTFIAELAYSYHVVLGPGTLGIGINAGVEQMSVVGQWISTDPYTQDAAIPDKKAQSATFDMGMGLYYTVDNGMFFGISATHIPETSIKASNTTAPGAVTNSFSYELARHYYVTAGYPFQVSQDIKIIPSMLAKTDGSSTQLDINGRVVWQDKAWIGLSYRLTDAIIFMAGVEWNRLKIGYSFDYTTSDLKNYNQGTHEIMLNYCFKPVKPTPSSEHRNVRFL
jgi:type IX secretion system PorP/SprF family membrane protein